ncbi:hypothetical protein L4D15_03655 [Enterovibrio norvegicus]|uniref:hypothetical protein n=1 Tax=Enterovibrio norvegicus TaxID=188144 RepID=UPI003D14E4EF
MVKLCNVAFVLLFFYSASSSADHARCLDLVNYFNKSSNNGGSIELSNHRDDWLVEYLDINMVEHKALNFREQLKNIEIEIIALLGKMPNLYNDEDFFITAIGELSLYYYMYGDYWNVQVILDNIDDENIHMLFRKPTFYSKPGAVLLVLAEGNGMSDLLKQNISHEIYNLDSLGKFYPEANGEDFMDFIHCVKEIDVTE